MTKKILNKLKSIVTKKEIFVIFCFLLFLVIPFNKVFAQNAGDYGALFSNTIGGAVAILLSWIALIITSVLGLLTTLLVQILVNVSKFNNIINVRK